jgi:hypothetical protein
MYGFPNLEQYCEQWISSLVWCAAFCWNDRLCVPSLWIGLGRAVAMQTVIRIWSERMNGNNSCAQWLAVSLTHGTNGTHILVTLIIKHHTQTAFDVSGFIIQSVYSECYVHGGNYYGRQCTIRLTKETMEFNVKLCYWSVTIIVSFHFTSLRNLYLDEISIINFFAITSRVQYF